ncbi:metallophosphoesterase [Niabella insulamsoli]|uniref:metallophosphoesterase n=1 Tax=Niabella insulamsoli TaxID=3144874 RepID=UPI0031FD89A6
MRILHIGDFHFRPNANNYDQSLMVDRMIECLKNKPRIDVVIFTGDLVFSGTKFENFNSAHQAIFLKLSKELLIPLSRIFLCQGNHDVNREEVTISISNYFDEKINDSDKLYDECTRSTSEFKNSFKGSSHFYQFLTSTFNDNFEHCDELHYIAKFKINESVVAIVAINSAWMSNGHRNDNGFLMFPPNILKNSISRIKDADCKILLLHHPMSYFKEFNCRELEDIIYPEFDLVFSGHTHREDICTKYKGHNGVLLNTTQATLSFAKDDEIGYSIIECDLLNKEEARIERATYISKEKIFLNLEPVQVAIPMGHEKSLQNKFRKKIASKYSSELSKANDLLLEYGGDNDKNFLELFTTPVLSSNSGAEGESPDKFFNFELLYEAVSKYLLFGSDKCGKTSLLKKIQLHYLKHFSTLGKVPFYLDYKHLEDRGDSKTDIVRLIGIAYDISRAETEKLLEENNIILLIDNLNTMSKAHSVIIDFLDRNRNLQFIVCSEFIASRVYFEELDHLDYTKLYFKDLTRREIRIYSEKNYHAYSESKEDVIEKVTKILQQLQLPVTYWTLSLILLIYKKSKDDFSHNLFGILDLCVDEMLQKKQLLLDRGTGFDQYKEICSHIAYDLLKNYRDQIYSTTSTNIITFIDRHISQNVRITTDARSVFDFLVTAGILKERNSKYTFRLNGVFEYFLAYYLHQHPEVKDGIIADDQLYLGFKNEFEIFSGLNRSDTEFLRQIYHKTRRIFDPIIEVYSDTSYDSKLIDKLGEVHEFRKKVELIDLQKALNHETQDQVNDELNPIGVDSEVHLKEVYDKNDLNPETLEKYLGILARVFKNCDSIRDKDLMVEIFDYIVKAHLCFGFHLMDAYTNVPLEENADHDENLEVILGKNVAKALSTFIPTIAQVLLYDGLGHSNMTRLIEERIATFKKITGSQYILFLLYFLLLDIDVKANKSLIDEVLENITLPPLRVSTYFKLNFYLAFKAYKNREFEQFISNKIRLVQLRLDAKNSSNSNMSLSEKQNQNIVKTIKDNR